jgi:hypothetical protein
MHQIAEGYLRMARNAMKRHGEIEETRSPNRHLSHEKTAGHSRDEMVALLSQLS